MVICNYDRSIANFFKVSMGINFKVFSWVFFKYIGQPLPASTVCAKVNDDFLNWCKEAGNDLITPHPEFGFPGLKDGDNWCVCATWFARAVEAGKECKIYLKKTNEKTLKIIPLEILKKHAIDLS